MIIDNEFLKVDENGNIAFTRSLWKLPSVEGAFDGILEGKPSKEQESEILNDIYIQRDDWLKYGPQPEAWDQFTEVSQIIGKRMRVQIWSAIMFMLEDEGPYPFEAHCVGVNLTLNQDGYLQCYMCFKEVSYPDADTEFEGSDILCITADGTYLLNLGDIYKISILNPADVKEKINTEKIILDFVQVAGLAGFNVEVNDIEIEILSAPHVPPSRLPPDKMAVYVFNCGNQCLKVGKVGSKSNARYTSQHYSPNSSNSNLAKSILKNASILGIDEINDQLVGNWIKDNTDRINFLIPERFGIPLLTLFEVFLQCSLKPRFEGFDSQQRF